MKIIKNVKEMQAWSDSIHAAGSKISFVPTMGFLHQGHLSLMERGKKLCGNLVVSIFVNPAQFGENEDLSTYPTDMETDLKLAEEKGAAVVFFPHKDEIYPDRFQTYVKLSNLPGHLCGISRPDHFMGVATVVTKLFNIVKPDVAVFGSKDFQQLQVIRQMTLDLNYDIEIIEGPIIREDDGLAMSSRNSYLKPDQRRSALCLSQSLKMAQKSIFEKETDVKKIKQEIIDHISSHPKTAIDYVSFCDPETLEDVDRIHGPVLLALAVKVGSTRLIDNQVMAPAE